MNNIDYQIVEGRLIVYFQGEIDSQNVLYYRKKLSSILVQSDGEVVFDFKETSFIDSAGVGLVLGRYQQLKNEGRTLYLRHLSKTAHKVFEISGLFELMEIIA